MASSDERALLLLLLGLRTILGFGFFLKVMIDLWGPVELLLEVQSCTMSL